MTADTAQQILKILSHGKPVEVQHIRNKVTGDYHKVLMCLVRGGLVKTYQSGYPVAVMVGE
jgi:hypothetical protein